jgi:hypothetical protein
MSGDRASHPGEHDHATPRDQELPDQELDQLTLHGIGLILTFERPVA